jgi:3,4-dihydroxy 2-butanone 4-phosphate synthase/GTP cyclohydrolase II
LERSIQVTRKTTNHDLSEPLAAAARAMSGGELVIVRDENDPAAGAYLVTIARSIDPTKINFMVTHGRGHICIAMQEPRMQALGVPLMATESPFSRRLAFGASIEASRDVTTGISASDRANTVLAASAEGACPDDIVMPGHVFPIQVRTGGVMSKADIPEASVDLCLLADESDSAAMCAILDEEGEVASPGYVAELAKKFSLEQVTVGDVVAHRLRRELVVERIAERVIEADSVGEFRAIVYRNELDPHEHMALVVGDLTGEAAVPVRVHSQCLTGDVLGSTRCDCGDQLTLAMTKIATEGRGAIIYMHQEGRGIGLGNKIQAYALQDCGRDTVEANLELGFEEDLREYGIAAQILKDLGIRRVRLLTNNPQKIEGLERYGVEVVSRDPIETSPHAENLHYLRTKRAKLGHLLDENSLESKTEPES